MNKNPSARIISLGCPKNLVDSEVILGHLAASGFEVVDSEFDSDIGIVNTCGFIEGSKQESINTILELAQQKKTGKLKWLVVAGCLAQRYPDEMPKLLPEVDAFIGTGDFSRLPEIIRSKMGGAEQKHYIRHPIENVSAQGPRLISTPSYMRYVKVSEGCSHACSFCTIPLMRGGLRSRTVEDILAEIESGVAAGVKEFNLVAQDLNEYGRDLAKRESLYRLLERLGEISGDFWVRLLYMYPLQFPDKLIGLIKNHPHVVPYVDIPLQHIDDGVLRSMKRGSSARYIHRLLDKLRSEIPGIAIRTTFIVGYPGETQKAFSNLKNFVEKEKFENLGVFTYSDEDGTPAFTLKKKTPQKIKEARRDEIMALQRGISAQNNARWRGSRLRVLYEGVGSDGSGRGRFYGQAPEIDGQVILPGAKAQTGDWLEVEITQTRDYDLVGQILGGATQKVSNFLV